MHIFVASNVSSMRYLEINHGSKPELNRNLMVWVGSAYAFSPIGLVLKIFKSGLSQNQTNPIFAHPYVRSLPEPIWASQTGPNSGPEPSLFLFWAIAFEVRPNHITKLSCFIHKRAQSRVHIWLSLSSLKMARTNQA